MFSDTSPLARDAKAWPFEQARLLLARLLRLRLPTTPNATWPPP